MKPIPDWFAWLDQAIAKEPTDSEYEKASRAARNWPTCACGQLCDSLPRGEAGNPADATLINLGSSFHVHICCKAWRAARRVMEQIEARTTELLTQPK